MEDTPKGIQMQLNNLGRIISLRKEQGKSLSEVASAMEMTKEGWRQIEIAYNKTYQSAVERLKHPAEPEEIDQIFQTIKDYAFSIQQMENLNQLFGLSVKNAVPDSSGPIAFSPDDFLQKQLENAAHRDLRLTQDILECISICGESDLQLLRQTITLLVKRDSSFQHSLSSMLLDAVRNHITNTMRYALPDDECFQKRLNKLAHIVRKDAVAKFSDESSLCKAYLHEELKRRITNLALQVLDEKIGFKDGYAKKYLYADIDHAVEIYLSFYGY